jgi:hypothetical protein
MACSGDIFDDLETYEDAMNSSKVVEWHIAMHTKYEALIKKNDTCHLVT